jgi:CheY-like chemotaxis protein
MDITMELESMGLTVIETNSIAEALAAIDRHSLQAAVLDLDVKGVPTTTVAEALRSRGIPFMVCSGSQFSTLSEIFADVPTIAKPFRAQDLQSGVMSILGSRG